MAKYKRLFVYKRESVAIMAEFVSSELTLEYDIAALVSNEITFLYNILATDARSLWEEKELGQALWEQPDPSNPTHLPEAIIVEEVDDSDFVILLEDGTPLLMESGESLEIEH